MARLTVEEHAIDDPRFKVLGALLGAPEEYAQAVGLHHAMRVWKYCQQHTVYVVPAVILDAFKTGLGDAMVAAQLSTRKRDGFRVHGTKGRIEWVKKLREGNRIRQQRRRVTHALVTRDNPGALTLTPALTQELQNPPTPRRAPRSVPYPDGFTKAWAAFPHFGQRSKKRKAFEIWQRSGLEAQADAVVAWIEAGKGADDWVREEGKFVPGMQVWLHGRDFSDPPAKRVRIEPVRPVAPWETANRTLTPEEIAARHQRERMQGVTA